MVRINRLPALSSISSEMDRLMQSFFRPGPLPFPSFGDGLGLQPFPPLNVWEDRDNVYAEAELPGFSMDDLEITMLGNELTISGERREMQVPQGAVFHRRERPAGEFTRTIRLGVPINADAVSAELNNGVLLVTLPKAEAARPRKIEVKSKK